MVEYNPEVKPLSQEQESRLISLKEELGEPKHATFGRWDVMIANDSSVYVIESNSCPAAFGDVRGMLPKIDGKGSPLDKACADYFADQGVIGMNSVGWNGQIVMPIFQAYGIPVVKSPTRRLFLHSKKEEFFFADKRTGTDRDFVDRIWIRAGKNIGKRVRRELDRIEERTGERPVIDPSVFVPSLDFLALSSHKYNLLRAIDENQAGTPPTVYIRNTAQWKEQGSELMEVVRQASLELHPDWKKGFELVLKPCYGMKGRGIIHGSIDDLAKIDGNDLKYPMIINPKIIASPHPERPKSNVDVGIYSIGMTLPTGFVKIGASGKLQTNLCAGGSCRILGENLRSKLEPHVQLAILSAEAYLRKET